LVPSFDRGNDFVRVCGPREKLGLIVGLAEEAVDGDLEIADGSKDAALEPTLWRAWRRGFDGIEPGR
jgi:hypothetical protein